MPFITSISNAEVGSSVRAKLNSLIARDNAIGWGDYVDSTYTELSPFLLSADTDTVLPNDGVNGPRGFLPEDSANPGSALNLFDTANNQIIGRNGDGLIVSIEYKVKPATGTATFIDTWIDIGAPIGELYRRTNTFPKGSGVERNIISSQGVYTLGTWEANGGTIYVNSNGPCEVYGIRCLLHRIYASNL